MPILLSGRVSPCTPGKLHHRLVDVVGYVCTIASFKLNSAFCCGENSVIIHEMGNGIPQEDMFMVLFVLLVPIHHCLVLSGGELQTNFCTYCIHESWLCSFGKFSIAMGGDGGWKIHCSQRQCGVLSRVHPRHAGS